MTKWGLRIKYAMTNTVETQLIASLHLRISNPFRLYTIEENIFGFFFMK